MSRYPILPSFIDDENIIRHAVVNSDSIRATLELLGSSLHPNNYKKLKILCNRYRIDNSHYGRAKCAPGINVKYTLEEVLVEDSHYVNIARLKKRLVSSGLLSYRCSDCNNDGTWNGKPITLQLDHINGKRSDHRIENLRFLCPNCHAQTETYAGKNSATLPKT
jgi:5-methylcytosine-specific restriction endonuclease McrA